jgi:hypothetical protein
VQVVVYVHQDAVRKGAPASSDPVVPADLAAVAAELGSRLEPMHPGVVDPELSRFFVLEVPDRQTAERAAVRMQQSPSVESAYWKPMDEAP